MACTVSSIQYIKLCYAPGLRAYVTGNPEQNAFTVMSHKRFSDVPSPFTTDMLEEIVLRYALLWDSLMQEAVPPTFLGGQIEAFHVQLVHCT